MGKHHSQNGWNDATVELMLGLKTSCSLLAYQYEKASAWYYKFHNLISIPVIIIMSIVGSATFTTLGGDCTGDTIWKVFAGTITIMAAIMTAVSNFLDFSAKSVLCKSTYVGFNQLSTEILRMLIIKPADRVPYTQFSQDMFTTYNKLLIDAPTLINRFKNMHQHDKGQDSGLDIDGYCVYVQSNRSSGLGGGLSYQSQNPKEKIQAINSKLSTVGIDSLGGREFRNLVNAAAYSSTSGSDSGDADTTGVVHVQVEP